MADIPTSDTPTFRMRGKYLVLESTAEADAVAGRNRSSRQSYQAKAADVVEGQAKLHLVEKGLTATPRLLLSHTELQFGQYRGQTFRWLLENAVGWVLGFVKSFDHESHALANESHLGINKRKLREYVMSFDIIREAVAYSSAVEAALAKARETGDDGEKLLEFGDYRHFKWRDLYESNTTEHQRYIDRFIIPKTNCIAGSKMDLFRKYCLKRRKVTPRQQPTKPVSRAMTVKPNLAVGGKKWHKFLKYSVL